MSAPETNGLSANSWRAMLEARPVRNAAADAQPQLTGDLRIDVRTRRPRYLVPPLSWIVPLKPARTVRLDPVGAEVWALCDGERTMEEIVDEFAARHRLTFHESRVAITGYMQQLVQRGALAIAVTD